MGRETWRETQSRPDQPGTAVCIQGAQKTSSTSWRVHDACLPTSPPTI